MQIEPAPMRLEGRRRPRIALGLAWATIALNTVEAVVVIGAGAVASSIALVSLAWTPPSRCWWWADPLAALVIAELASNEGREAWRGEH